MNGLAQAERDFDRRLPSDGYLVAELDDLDCASVLTDLDVEQFIVDLVAAADPVAFLENEANQHFNEEGDFDLHVAVARQWVANKGAVGGIIGAVFWTWAKRCAYEVAA